ncbi:DUF4328 domain-containing protein [Promicromonospora sukumoe]|uniref:DUF4328 domain-containing protein n=1 Tax=Promicromonospora sukumoe TaxID=88382 RepID=UPI0037C61D32
MTHDPFVPPAGSTFPAAPPVPTGPVAPGDSSTAGPTAGPVAAPYWTPQSARPPVRSAAGLGVAVIVLASVWTAVQVLVSLLAPEAVKALRRADLAGLGARDSNFTTYDAAGLLSVLVQVAAFLVTCFWLTASRNIATAVNPTFAHKRGPVWVWLGWVVPVVSLWFPFQVVRDVGRSTSRASVPAIGGWWAAWLVYLGTSNLAGRLTSSPTEGSAANAADVLVGMEGIATVSMIVALVLWVGIVRDVTHAQRARIAALG